MEAVYLAKWCETWNKKKPEIKICLCHSVGMVHLSTGVLRLCKSGRQVYVLAIISVRKKNGWKQFHLLASPIFLPAVHTLALLKVSICSYSVSQKSTPDMYSRHSHPGPEGDMYQDVHCGFVYGAREGGDNKVFIPVGTDVQNVVAAHSRGLHSSC